MADKQIDLKKFNTLYALTENTAILLDKKDTEFCWVLNIRRRRKVYMMTLSFIAHSPYTEELREEVPHDFVQDLVNIVDNKKRDTRHRLFGVWVDKAKAQYFGFKLMDVGAKPLYVIDNLEKQAFIHFVVDTEQSKELAKVIKEFKNSIHIVQDWR